MANSFITVKSIAREALPRLIDNLVMPNLVYRDYSPTFTNLGDTIQVKKPVVYTAQDFTVGSSVNAQDVKENSVDVKLDKIATVDINIGAIEGAVNFNGKLVEDFIEPAAVALAEKINRAGLELYKKIPNALGTAGTTPDGLDDLANARKFLNAAKAPLSDRRAIWDVEADAAFTQIPNLVRVNESGSPRALREGEIGRVYGIDNYMSQAVASATGAITAATTVKLASATTAGTSTTLSISGATLTGKLVAGDIINVGGTCYTVKVDTSAAATNAISGIVVNEPIQTHAANTAVTLVYGGTQNLVFHKNAIAFVNRPLAVPAGVEAYTTSYNGFSLRVVRGYDIATKTEKMSMDVLYGYEVVYPELAARYLG